jgi:putative ABC transport system permease protein
MHPRGVRCGAAVAPVVRRGLQVVSGNANWGTSVQGTSAEFVDIRAWPLQDGGMFSDSDVRGAAKVAVLGSKVKEQLFGDQSPINHVVRIKDIPFRVVGVLSYKGGQTFGGDQDDIVLVPYTTAQRRLLGITYLNNVMVSAVSERSVPEAVQQITDLLRQRHRIRPGMDDDFFLFPARDADHAESTSGS